MEKKDSINVQILNEVREIRKTGEEIKKLEMDRLFEEGLFRTLENSSLMGIYVVQDGIFKFVNQHTYNYWGYTREELLGMASMSIVHPEDRHIVKTCAIDMLKGARFSPYVFRTIARNGSIRWITETVTTIHYQGRRAVLGNSMDITEQINSRNKLAELEALEASILEAIPHAVIGLKNRRIIFANDGVKTVFGWMAEELIGHRTRRLYRTERDFEEIAGKLYKTLETERTVSLEFLCRRKDGKDIVCMINAARIGEILTDKQIVITYEDITDRKQAEEVYKTLANSSQAGVYVVQSGAFQFVNHHAAAYAGYGEEELVGMDSMSLVHPEDRAMVRKNAKSMLSGKRKAPHEFRIITKNGDIRWIMETVTKIPFRGEMAVLGNSMDITEQISSREKLEELEALEASILESIPHAVIGLQDRRIIFANDGVQTVFGWKHRELIGMSTRVLYRSDEDYEEMARSLYGALEEKRTVTLEFPCCRKDGRSIDCMVTAVRIGDSLREKNIVITYEDITDRKFAAAELEKSRQQLRSLTAHLQSIREKERTRIARELHDELGQLLTALNTEIILMGKKIPPKLTSLVERTQYLSSLIDMTMDTLKRIYTDLRPGMLDLLGLTAAIGWQAGDFEKRTGIRCQVSFTPEEIVLDPELSTALFRIFQETITNISRHANASLVKVSMKATDEKVQLIVKDNGKGITQEQMTKPNSFGLLGIRERAEYWGGEVVIKGKSGEGTTVNVTMPLIQKGVPS
ncbi:MAG: hypothetical protein CSYNP_01900 [Syntrophus sp. SKADARSKE-3]|nr:hypothetical protein [Syntrophus sp. SKADARSKE-3]